MSSRKKTVVVLAVIIGFIGMIAAFATADFASTSVAFISEGECFAEFSQFETPVDGDESILVQSVDEAACEEPHALEAYYVGDAYEFEPGPYSTEMITEVAVEVCEREFARFVGLEWEFSELDYWWLTPSEPGWRFGDRELVCLVGEFDRSMTVGTLEGVNR